MAGHAVGQEHRPSQSNPELDLSAYEAELDYYAILIQSAKGHPGEISRLRVSLPSAWIVDADSRKLTVSTESLDAALAELQLHPEKSDSLSRDALVRVATMRESAIALEKVPAFSGASAQNRLTTILQRREFSGPGGPSPLERWEARAGRWIGEKILWLLQSIHVGANTGNFLAWTVIAIAFILLCYWAYRILPRSARRINLPAVNPFPLVRARQWANEASAAAQRGEYREAVHCAYWAAVSRLEDLNLLPHDQARTPRESLRMLGSHPDQQDPLRELTRDFELIWYGNRPASATDWSSARVQLERMGCLKVSTAATANS
jgi:hypothetical protein